jgi:MGT family glycosyltransferase
MSHILVYTSPARGHLYPMMDVALALRGVGHRVTVQTLAAERAAVLAAGVEHRAIAPAIEALPLTDYRGGNPLAKLQATFDTWVARAPHEIADLRSAEAELAPDLLIVDANTWGAVAVAEASARRWAMFLPYVLPLASPDVPAFGPGFAPPRSALERLRDRALRSVLAFCTRAPLARLDRLRAELGVAGVGSFEGLFTRADVLLYRTAPPFDYPRRQWPENVHPIGPGLWAPPGEAPGWLAQLPRPRVLVSVSTELQEDGAIIEVALQGLADEPGSVIVTTAALDPDRFVAPHDRVRITRFLPHAEVVSDVDVVVTHGGMGTTQRALAAGVPVVVVPWGRDQSETARRAEVSGAGVMLPPARLTPERLRGAVRTAHARRPQAEAVARAFREAGGADRAVALLEGLLREADAAPAARPDVAADSLGPAAQIA